MGCGGGREELGCLLLFNPLKDIVLYSEVASDFVPLNLLGMYCAY